MSDESILVEAKSLRDVVGLSRPRVYALMAAGEFPLPRRISPGRIAWLRSDLETWAASRPVSVEPVRRIVLDCNVPRAELPERLRKREERQRIRAERKRQRAKATTNRKTSPGKAPGRQGGPGQPVIQTTDRTEETSW